MTDNARPLRTLTLEPRRPRSQGRVSRGRRCQRCRGHRRPLSTGAIHVLKGQQGQHPEFVFTYRGRPIKEIKTAFIAACVRSGCGHISAEGRYTGFTWHGFRHTWATWHVQHGTPLDVLQKLGAWKDERMVQNYAHHSPGYLAQFADNARNKKTL